MKRVLIVACAVLATVLPAAGQVPRPMPSPAPQAKAAMGYYLVQGSRIVSKPFDNDLACHKALVALQRGLRPGTETVFCAHRRP